MKSAQLGFVKALSQELARTSVTVNAIAPGFVAGNMASEWQEDELQAMITELPQQRLVLPSEVAHTCAYLYHPNARVSYWQLYRSLMVLGIFKIYNYFYEKMFL